MIRIAIAAAVLAIGLHEAHAGGVNHQTNTAVAPATASSTANAAASSVGVAFGTGVGVGGTSNATNYAEGTYSGSYQGGNNFGLALPSTALTSSGDCIGSVTLPLIGGGSTYKFDDCKIKGRISLYREAAKDDPANAEVYKQAQLMALCKLDDVASELPLCPKKSGVKLAKTGRE